MAEFFAPAARGTEAALCRELRELGLDRVHKLQGGAGFTGFMEDGMRACIHARLPTRIQMQVASFPCTSEGDLYEGARAVDWESYLTPRHTLAVAAVGRSDALRHSGFVAQKTKDAVVDRMRDQVGARPSVDLDDPDLRIAVFVGAERTRIYVDLSGESLHMRGYRVEAGEAPLRETLAAALVRLSGWGMDRPFMDPFCGSGTLAIEAALMAWNVAPGLLRKRFGFERWASHDRFAEKTLRELLQEARWAIRRDASAVPEIFASDLDPKMVALAQRNADRAGVPITFSCRRIEDVGPTVPPGLLVTNPPWGERLGVDAPLVADTRRALGALHGHRVCVLAGSPVWSELFEVPPKRRFPVVNGNIDCELLCWDLP